MARQSSIATAFERIGGVNALPVILMVIALPLVGSFSSWVTLTVAGLAMGMMIFYTNVAARLVHAGVSRGLLARTQAWRGR